MATPFRQQPFVVRALVFACIYTLLATAGEYFIWRSEGEARVPNWEHTYRYFLIGLVVAGGTLLFLDRRRPKLPK